MLSRPKYWSFMLSAALVVLPNLALPEFALGQIIWSDDDFQQADYTASGAGVQDVRFNFNYSNFDVFGDNFLQVTIPDAPRGGGAGVFISANNNSIPVGSGGPGSQLSFASISPTLANVNVGTGTANPNYVMRVDVFNSTGTGLGGGALAGTTTYGFVGLNQTDTTVQMQALNDPGGGRTGQGLHLAITGDSGGAEDFVPVVGGALYRDREGLAPVTGRTYDAGDGVNTGLASQVINKFWLDFPDKDYVISADGLAFVTATPTDDDLNAFRGDSLFTSPDPEDLAGFHEAGTGVQRRYWFEEFGKTTAATHFTGGTGLTSAPNANDTMAGGVPYNRWATHELYWVDGTFTYVIDGVPVQQFTPTAQNTPNLSNLSTAGTGVLGFWDLFGGSIALSPDGGNFIVYDNLEFEVADASDVPSLMGYLVDNGYLPGAEGIPGDFNGDEKVDGRDFLVWQRDTSVGSLSDWQDNYGTGGLAAVAVPEPASLVMLMSLAGLAWGNARRR